MKTRIILFSLLGILFSFSSCQKIQDSLTVTVPVEFDVNLDVKSFSPDLKSTNEGPFAFSVSETFDPSTNADVQANLAKIRSVIATGMTYTVSGLSQNILLYSATLVVKNATNEVRWDFTNQPFENGLPIAFTFTADQQTKFNAMLDALTEITITWSGTQSSPVIDYTLALKIKADVKAAILGE